MVDGGGALGRAERRSLGGVVEVHERFNVVAGEDTDFSGGLLAFL